MNDAPNDAPWHWLRKVEDAVLATKEIPLWGSSPSFPWGKFEERLSEVLAFPCRAAPHQTEWKAHADLKAGMGDHPVIFPLDLEPLTGVVYWMMSREDITKLTSTALSSQSGFKGFSDLRLQEGFYRFLFLEALNVVDQLGIYGGLSPRLREQAPLPQEGALCVDVKLMAGKHVLWGRLICPQPIHEAFKAHFATMRHTLGSSEMSKELEVPIRLEAGHASLSLEEWKQVACGDFILLERCSFDPSTHKGTVTMLLHKTPLFRARLKADAIKILDYAFYYEETMDNKFGDHTSGDDEDRENSPSDENFREEEAGSEEHLWQAQPKQEEGALESMLSTQQIPLTLTVEVAKLQINVDKLLQLKPGNTLELDVRPEQGVDLTVGGKRVAKGELIKLGESLGVKILHIGEH
jgi:flagellar motor switch protein FliN/FliY